MNLALCNAFVVDGAGVQRKDIFIENGRIHYDREVSEAYHVVDLSGKYALPGLVDIHFHGMCGFDFTSGWYNDATSQFDEADDSVARGLDMLRQMLPAHGVTGFYVATQAQIIDYLQSRLDILADYMDAQVQTPSGARLWGALLEGSFINPASAGAQNGDWTLTPNTNAFDELNHRKVVRLANVVPDYDEASYQLIQHLTRQGVVVGAGHTQATGNQVTQAVKAGLRYCIHFTNGLMSHSYKPFKGGGAIEGVLYNDTLFAEIIADGFHVAPAYVRDIITRKGVERIIGVTDAMFAAHTQFEHITWVGKQAHVEPQRRYIALASGDNMLAGSLLMMDMAVENMLNWLTVEMDGVWTRLHPALTLEMALTAAVRMYAENPCRLTGLDRKGFGRLAEGAPADLCIMNIEGQPGAYHVDVEQTLVNGVTVFEQTHAI